MGTRSRRLSSPARAALLAFGAWSLAWKSVSLWQAARDGDKRWYAALLALNTAGILDALYLFRFSPNAGRARLDRRREAVDDDRFQQRTHTSET